jgi:oligopeptide transport system ATP-binding protein
LADERAEGETVVADRVLEVKNLSTHFFSDEGVVRAVDGVSFHVDAEETLGIVGESGCGKSVTSLSIMQLVPSPPGKIVGGQILFQGQDLLKKSPEEMRKIRGNDIAMIFQEPMTSLNPVYTIGDQIAEAVILHQKVSKREALQRAIEMLRLVGIPAPERRVHDYPHQLSGGMRQRVMIAMALSCNPTLLIADEPTTALDVTIQAQILELMKSMKQEFHMAITLITHDLGVVAEMTERVIVMYAGKVVEEAPTVELFQEPLHPYTQGLMNSIPRLDQDQKTRLHVIEGTVPNLLNLPKGCSFAPRCPQAMPICHERPPLLTEVSDTRKVSCWLHANPEEAVS